jgi:hypothetical protein
MKAYDLDIGEEKRSEREEGAKLFNTNNWCLALSQLQYGVLLRAYPPCVEPPTSNAC